MRRRSVLHVITTLDVGGAETMLHNLLTALPADQVDSSVVCLAGPGAVGDRITRLGVPVVNLGLRRAPQLAVALPRLVRLMRSVAPDVVQTWMYHADLLGGVAARLARVPTLAWGLHASDLDPAAMKPSTMRIVRANARLSARLPDLVVCSSERTRQIHFEQGYPAAKMRVIRNGFPMVEKDVEGARKLRAELGVADDELLVGRVARFHRQKDYETFIRAAEQVTRRCPTAKFLLCGEGVTWDNPALTGWIRTTGSPERFNLLGVRERMTAVHAAVDVAVSSSAFGETFPLAIGEAMVQGTVAVVTDVGDCATLVGPTGRVVPPGNAGALADAVSGLLALSSEKREALGRAATARIAERFTIGHTASAYLTAYEELGLGGLP